MVSPDPQQTKGVKALGLASTSKRIEPPRLHARLFIVGLVGIGLSALLALLPAETVLILAGALVALALLAIIFAEPVIGLALTLFISPFAPLENIMVQLPIESGQVLLILTAIAWLARMLYRRKMGISTGPLLWPLLFFIAVGFTSFFAAQSAELWAKECLKWVEVLFVYALTVSEIRTSTRSRNIIIAAILISTLFEAGLGIYQFWLRGTGPESFLIAGLPYYRSYGTFEQPNPFGGYMGLTWPFTAGMALIALRKAVAVMRNRPLKWTTSHIKGVALAVIATVIAMMALLALVMSWSRGAWLGAGAAAVVMLIVALRKPFTAFAILAGVIALILALNTAGLIPESLTRRLTGFTEEFSSLDVRHVTVTGANHAVIERLAHWQAAQNMIIDKPWFGIGFGNYGAAYDQYRTLNWPLALGHAHNYYLNIFAETGIIGLLAYLILWISVIVRSIRAARQPDPDAPSSRSEQSGMGIRHWQLGTLVAFGLVGTWVQLSVHQVVDNLFVANIFLLIGVYFGLLDGLNHEPTTVHR
jgi:putative inorganic carbon (HCO3(-)) transporter